MTESVPNEWWSARNWADLYRSYGLAVIPAVLSADGKKKHPAGRWQEFQENGIPQAVHDKWFDGPSKLMGFLTGKACFDPDTGLVVIDVDIKDGKRGDLTWQAWLTVHNHGMQIETWIARTGSGGLHYYFKAPVGRLPHNTQETIDGIDVRGVGGFIMAPPSPHYIPGTEYEWMDGYSPWETDIADAPDWLLDELHSIAEVSFARTDRVTQTDTPDRCEDVFGNTIDGRDKKLADYAYRAMLDAYRLCPIKPGLGDLNDIVQAAFETYVATTDSRIPKDGRSRAERLEAEGRGITAFREKIARHYRTWDDRLAKAARSIPRHIAERKAKDEEGRRVLAAVLAWMREDGHPDTPWLEELLSRPFEQEQPKAEQAEAPKTGIIFETVADLRKLPPTKWLIKGWVSELAVGIFYGKWGAGKSFVGFDLAQHLAHGFTDWHGVPLPDGGRDVLIIAREGHAGFVKRIDAFNAHHKVTEDTGRLIFMRASISFMEETQFSALVAALKAAGRTYALTLVDTVARVLPGADMNEQAVVTRFMERCQTLSDVTGGAVIGVHHQNKTGTMMGSVYFEANADFVFEITRDGEEGALESGSIKCTKQKDGEDGWTVPVAYAKILTGIGTEDSSLVVKAIGGDQQKPQSKLPPRDVCERILAFIDAAWRQGNPLNNASQTKTSGRYAPRILGREFGVNPKAVEDLILSWIDSATVSVEVCNSHTKTRGLRVIGAIK
jgi:hypothetical protein